MKLVFLWATLAAASGLAKTQGVGQGQQELILFLVLDATRADHLGAYGYPKPTTPVIDGLARAGTTFTRAYSNAPWTRPSMTSFLTGLHTSRHGTETEKSKLESHITTVAERLQTAGWTNLAFVANGHAGSMAKLERGFDHFEDPTETYVKGARGTTYLNRLPTGSFIVDKALSALKTNRAAKTFVYMFFVDAHDPYETDPALEALFLPPNPGNIRRHALWEYNNNYPAQERENMIAVYDAGIRAADRAIGRLLEGIEQLGQYAKPTIIVTADHGEGFGEHGFYLHAHHFWEEVIHIPLMISAPGFQPGQQDGRLTDSLDVAATVVRMAGAQGQGLPGIPLQQPATSSKVVISEYNEYGIHRQAILNDRYKVILQLAADEAWFMQTIKNKAYFPSVIFSGETLDVYDLQQDPLERHNLASAMPPPAKVLLGQLRTFLQDKPATNAKSPSIPLPVQKGRGP